MPPIKGRMMGLQASRTGGDQASQSNLDFRNVKNLGIPRKKSKFAGNGKNATFKTVKDEQLKRLRIPAKICKSLPSVKKFSNSKGFIDITEDESFMPEEVSEAPGTILGLKRGRGAENKYHIQATVEKRFNGMVWDLAFCPHSKDLELLVSCGDGVFICDSELNRKKELSRVRLAGGVGYLSDGRIVVLCRFMDVINVYSSTGEFLNDFSCGMSPMTVAINAKDEIMVSDCSTKEIHFYQSDGTLLKNIAPRGNNYKLVWPLYMAVMKNSDFIVVDCHQQIMMVFDQRGQYVRSIPMRTYGGSEVLRPHGICLTAQKDLCIVDNAINTVEVFSTNGTYFQTLLPTEEGSRIRPKIMACSKNGHMAIGGMKGHVRLFKFVAAGDAKLELTHSEMKVETVESENKVRLKIKKVHKVIKSEVKVKPEVEVKTEVNGDEVTVIVLD